MAKRKQQPKNYNVAEMMPDELSALKALVKEFIGKVENVDNEIETLKEDRRELLDEYKEKLDTQTLAIALRVLKLRSRVAHKDTFDMFMEVLTDPAQ